MTLPVLYVFHAEKTRLGNLETSLRALGYTPQRVPARAAALRDALAKTQDSPCALLIETEHPTASLVKRLQKAEPRGAAFWFHDRPSRSLPGAFEPSQVFLPSDDGAAIEHTIRARQELCELRQKLQEVRAYHAEEARYREILTDVIHAANSSLEIDVVLEVVMNKIRSLIQAEGWSILLATEDKQLVFKRVLGPKGDCLINEPLKPGQGIAGWVVERQEPALINDVVNDPRFEPSFDKKTGFHTRSMLCAPLVSRGKTIGAVEVLNKKARDGFTQNDLAMLCTLLEPASVAIENALLFEEVRRLTVTDDLTRLYNSRYFNDVLEREIGRSKRHNNAVSLVFLDLDNFKTVNDRFGHLAGSRTLCEVGRILQEAARVSDVVCRYGGDEFTMVLPQTDEEGGKSIAERARKLIEDATLLQSMDLAVRITASFGVASYPTHVSSRVELVQAADAAMYYVKLNGKNGVAVAPTGQPAVTQP
ncbi:MAG: sensor domain-containing diguanylate cyclase [Acidobacteriota bacterium]|nr:MAG: sensor domain-containing diguanylate cyclase [Acidobacteriota bacterium]